MLQEQNSQFWTQCRIDFINYHPQKNFFAQTQSLDWILHFNRTAQVRIPLGMKSVPNTWTEYIHWAWIHSYYLFTVCMYILSSLWPSMLGLLNLSSFKKVPMHVMLHLYMHRNQCLTGWTKNKRFYTTNLVLFFWDARSHQDFSRPPRSFFWKRPFNGIRLMGSQLSVIRKGFCLHPLLNESLLEQILPLPTNVLPFFQ
jgi:hypothetical protein